LDGSPTNRWFDIHRGLDIDLGLYDDDRRVGDGLVYTCIPPMPLGPSVVARVLLVMGRRRGGGRSALNACMRTLTAMMKVMAPRQQETTFQALN
jgi:hypothetical protein